MQRRFYATADDLIPIFESVEAKLALAYTLTGLFERPQVSSVNEGVQLSTLRAAAPIVPGPSYLVMPADSRVVVREVPQSAGGMRFAVDQLANEDSVTFAHGGFFTPEVLLPGCVGTASDSKTSAAIYRAFANAIATRFVRVRAYYVGPHALELLHKGCRLALGARSPEEFDLRP